MPNADFTSDTTWTMPDFTNSAITVTVIGAGGGGGGDSGSGTDGGGGGGGGGFRQSNVSASPGQSITINIGNGGQGETDGRAERGDDTTVSSSNFSVNANGGQGGGTSDGGSGGGPNGQDGEREYSESSARAGGGGGAGQPSGNSGRGNPTSNDCFNAGGQGGDGTNLDGGDNNNGGAASCGDNNGRNGGAFGGGGGGGAQGSRGGRGANGAARISYTFAPPTAQICDRDRGCDSPTTVTSNSGTPQYSAGISWSTTSASSVTVTGFGSVEASGQRNITGPQSVAGSNSPATVTYTVSASGPGGGPVTDSHTIQFYNDNNPSSITVSSVVNPGNLNRTSGVLAPNTDYDVSISFSGTDMPCIVQTSDSNIRFSNSSSTLVSANSTFTATIKTAPFNTSTTPGGVNSSGFVVGQTNSRTYTFTIGSSETQSFTAVTRAPVIQEVFNAEGPLNVFPHPDIDTVTPNPNTFSTTSTGIDIVCNDIEIAVPMKTNDPNVQANINQSGWRDLPSI